MNLSTCYGDALVRKRLQQLPFWWFYSLLKDSTAFL